MALRELMAVVGLLSFLFAVDTAFGSPAPQSEFAAYTILLAGTLVITLIVKLVVYWSSFQKGTGINLLSALIATTIFVIYFCVTQSYHHPKLYAKIGFSFAIGNFASLGFLISLPVTFIFDRSYGHSTDSENAG